MPTYNLNQAKTHLSSLIEEVQQGKEITITRYGKPVAKLVSIEKPGKRKLGFYPVEIKSDLLEPTDPEIIESFYQD
jgi:prevent-host-death family protein